jgi:branched-chain amino acid transport system substrate-binding protein
VVDSAALRSVARTNRGNVVTCARAQKRGRRSVGAILATGVALTLSAFAVSPALGQSPSTPQVVRVGALLSITGGGSSLGNTSRAALEVARDQWNQRLARSHQNRRVELDVVDTGQDPVRATAGFNQLADQGVRIIIGPQSSSEVAAIQPLANARGVLVVSQGSTASSLAQPNDNVFRFVPNDHVEGRATTDLVEKQGARAVVEMWRNDRGNQGLSDSVRSAATADGLQVTAGVRYEPTTTDYGPALAELGRQVSGAVQQFGADHVAVYLAGFEEVANVLPAAAQVPGLAAVRWYGGDGSAQAPQLIDTAGSAAFAIQTRGYPSPLVALPADRAQRDAGLIAQIARRAHATPDAFALAAYDAFDVAVQTLLKSSATVDGPTLQAAFRTTATAFPGVTGIIRLDPSGDRASAPYAYWSICQPRGRKAQWVRTGTWTASGVATGRGTVQGGTCPR